MRMAASQPRTACSEPFSWIGKAADMPPCDMAQEPVTSFTDFRSSISPRSTISPVISDRRVEFCRKVPCSFACSDADLRQIRLRGSICPRSTDLARHVSSQRGSLWKSLTQSAGAAVATICGGSRRTPAAAGPAALLWSANANPKSDPADSGYRQSGAGCQALCQ